MSINVERDKLLEALDFEAAPDPDYVLSVDSEKHKDYGLTYPVTYIFNIPVAAVDMEVFYRFSIFERWIALDKKTTTDLFNGVNAVRFDYATDKAYVSVAFAAHSDHVFLRFTEAGSPATVTFDTIPEYYDNRVCAVCMTIDDFAGMTDADEPDAELSVERSTEKGVVVTLGVQTQCDIGQTIQTEWKGFNNRMLANGFVEIASHSRTHDSTPPYADYDGEIGGSKQDLIAHALLLQFQKNTRKGYVWAWIEPGGASDATIRTKLGEYKYLIARDTSADDDWATWDAANGLYNRIGYSIRMGSDGTEVLATLNDKFDAVKAAGGVYHLMCHHWTVNWAEDGYADDHLRHIAQVGTPPVPRKDIWLVGFGSMYMYHYVDDQSIVSITTYASWSP